MQTEIAVGYAHPKNRPEDIVKITVIFDDVLGFVGLASYNGMDIENDVSASSINETYNGAKDQIELNARLAGIEKSLVAEAIAELDQVFGDKAMDDPKTMYSLIGGWKGFRAHCQIDTICDECGRESAVLVCEECKRIEPR